MSEKDTDVKDDEVKTDEAKAEVTPVVEPAAEQEPKKTEGPAAEPSEEAKGTRADPAAVPSLPEGAKKPTYEELEELCGAYAEKVDELKKELKSEKGPVPTGVNPFRTVFCGEEMLVLAQDVGTRGVLQVINGAPVFIPGASLSQLRNGTVTVG